MALDLIIRNGTIIDGSGRLAFTGDIAVREGKITQIGNLSEASAELTLDASGLSVCPGFIDMHSHSDLSLMAYRRGESSLSQGITTEVIGNCGWSMAPVKEETRQSVLRGLISRLVHKEAHDNLDWSWHSFGEFMDRLEAGGIGVNVAPLVGQSLLRAHVVGTEKRGAAPGEVEAMRALVRQAMEDGAWGMSTGRSYLPGGNAPTEEIIELAKVAAEYDGIYATHMKNEGDELFDAVDEVITIAEKTGARVEISHHKAVGKRNFGKVHRSLEMIDKARRRGLQITVDVYPYEFSQASSLAMVLLRQAWSKLPDTWKAGRGPGELPSPEEIDAALKNVATVEKAKNLQEMVLAAEKMSDYLVVRAPSSLEAEGRVLGGIAAEAGKSMVDLIAELLVGDRLDVWVAMPISIEDVHTVISADFAVGGTDAFNVDRPIWPTPIHPRHFGTFPRIAGRYVTQHHLFTLEDAIRKCTYIPATIMGIHDRGLVQVGYWADLVVFDPARLMDMATGVQPYLRATGIEYVLVNGKVVAEKGKVKPVFAGKVLRHK